MYWERDEEVLKKELGDLKAGYEEQAKILGISVDECYRRKERFNTRASFIFLILIIGFLTYPHWVNWWGVAYKSFGDLPRTILYLGYCSIMGVILLVAFALSKIRCNKPLIYFFILVLGNAIAIYSAMPSNLASLELEHLVVFLGLSIGTVDGFSLLKKERSCLTSQKR